MHEGDVDVEWDAGTTAVKDFEGEVDATHAGSAKASSTRARTEAFGSAAILRSPAFGTAPSRVVPKPPDDDADAAPEPVTVKEWTAPTEASPLAKARRATSQRRAPSSELPLAAPEPSVLAPLAPPAPPTPAVVAPVEVAAPASELASPAVTFDAPLPTLRIEKIGRWSTAHTLLAAVLLVAVASGTYAIGRRYQSRPQPRPVAAAAPSTTEVTKIVMPTMESPISETTAPAPAVSQVEAQAKPEPAKPVVAVQAKPARLVAKKKVVRPKAKAARRAKAPSTTCTALDCL